MRIYVHLTPPLEMFSVHGRLTTIQLQLINYIEHGNNKTNDNTLLVQFVGT